MTSGTEGDLSDRERVSSTEPEVFAAVKWDTLQRQWGSVIISRRAMEASEAPRMGSDKAIGFRSRVVYETIWRGHVYSLWDHAWTAASRELTARRHPELRPILFPLTEPVRHLEQNPNP